MTPGRMTDVILVTMMTDEEVAAEVVMTIIVVADGTMIAPEITAEETLTIVVVEIGMMTGGARGRHVFFSLAAANSGCWCFIYCLYHLLKTLSGGWNDGTIVQSFNFYSLSFIRYLLCINL